MIKKMNPDLSDDLRYTFQKQLNGTPEERSQVFNHPQFSILDWEACNGHWRQIPRWVEDRSLKNILQKIQQKAEK